MKTKFWKSPRTVRHLIAFSPRGQISIFSTDFSFDGFDQVLVSSTGKTMLHLGHHGQGGMLNQLATGIVDDQRTVIRGIGYLVSEVEECFKMRIWATYEEVAEAIENLHLSSDPSIEDVGVRVPQQNIYATNREDLLTIQSYFESR